MAATAKGHLPSLNTIPKIDTAYQRISDENPCRSSQIKFLQLLFGQNQHATVSPIFIYGHSATGKLSVVSSILRHQSLPHAIVNCVEFYSPKLMFEEVLCQVSGVHPCSENEYTTFEKCDSMNEFIHGLRRAISYRTLEKETVYVVLDKAERLRDMDANLLPAFLRLGELTQRNICVVLLSEIVWEKFRSGTGCLDPLVIHFPDYNRDELLVILAKDRPAEVGEVFYQGYLNLLLSVFYLVCRDLTELRYLAKLNFGKYVEPVRLGEATENESKKLWRNIEPHLRTALNTVYLREVSSAQWEKYLSCTDDDTDKPLSVHHSRIHVELPYFSKYLLIAAYISSYNPAKSDKRFFLKRAEKMRKGAVLAKHKRDRTNNQLLGPKPFPLDRLMAIFYSIVDGKVLPTAYIYSQITSLVNLHLLSHMGQDDQIDSPKYKCLVSLDTIRHVAKTVDFEIMRYLYDFV